MEPRIHPLRHSDVSPVEIPTGEILLDTSHPPYKVWVPSTQVIVLGNSQDLENELHIEAVQADRIPVFKRQGGGGAVLLSPGCLCVGLRLRKMKEKSIADYFSIGAQLVQSVIQRELGLELVSRGISDLAYGDLKVAGCSLYLPRDFALYLVSVLVNPDFTAIDRYLAYPSKEPDYRAGRNHRSFIGGLATLAGRNVTAEDLIGPFESAIQSTLNPVLDIQTL